MNTQPTAVTAPKRSTALLTKFKAPVVATIGLAAMASTSAQAALDSTVVEEIKTEVLADVSLAVGAGFAVLAVVLASSIGFSLLGTFIKKGASGG